VVVGEICQGVYIIYTSSLGSWHKIYTVYRDQMVSKGGLIP
jgi:hypothetical protein